MASRDVVVVPHTHWDREWYEPYQYFRMRLVELLDNLLDQLEADPGYAHFMLDGQMAVVDDYLEIRPENAERIRALAVSGRLGMGPWYILMDEFLVSGETMVRNLQLGLSAAGRFGGAMEVGYLPDMFGHIAQMPQLLAGFGFADAVVWRGVPNAVDAAAFTWCSPDGSSVRAEFLVDGYSNGAHLPLDGKELVEAIERFDTKHRHLIGTGPILWMNGTDHLMPQPWLGRVVAEANEVSDTYRVRVASLVDHLASAPTDNLPTWSGELRSGGRSNLLMGVLSNHIDVHQAAAAAERSIERTAEPLAALFQPASGYPRAFLDLAWKELIRNSAHDTSCACSVDEVITAALHRYHEARRIGEGVAERAAKAVASSLATAGPVVVNPTARDRAELIEVVLPGHDPVEGTQLIQTGGGPIEVPGLTRDGVSGLLTLALDYLAELRGVEFATNDDGSLRLLLHADPDDPGPRYAGNAAATMAELVAEDADAPASIGMVYPEIQRVLAHTTVPGFGWSRWTAAPLGVEPVEVVESSDGGVTITNGRLTVVVDPTDGTFALDGTAGLGRLVDGGDTGDTYNYNPPANDTVVDIPDRVGVLVIDRGPLRARVLIERDYTWPAKASGDARTGEVTTTVSSTLEIHADSSVVRVSTTLDNRSEDHRLRVVFPLPRPASQSHAECAFAVVTRGLDAEGGFEHPLPTFPSRRFVIAGGLTIIHDGLPEYELVDLSGEGDARAAHALALTLLRCTGLVSQGPMASRAAPAGPIVPAEAAQLPGLRSFTYAVVAGDSVDRAYAAADEVLVPLTVHRAPGGGTRADLGFALAVHGAEVSAVTRDAGQLTVRVFNPSDTTSTVRVDGRKGWLVDLRGRPLEPFETMFELRPWGIATMRLDDD
jgi:alpha-mannosidase